MGHGEDETATHEGYVEVAEGEKDAVKRDAAGAGGARAHLLEVGVEREGDLALGAFDALLGGGKLVAQEKTVGEDGEIAGEAVAFDVDRLDDDRPAACCEAAEVGRVDGGDEFGGEGDLELGVGGAEDGAVTALIVRAKGISCLRMSVGRDEFSPLYQRRLLPWAPTPNQRISYCWNRRIWPVIFVQSSRTACKRWPRVTTKLLPPDHPRMVVGARNRLSAT
jgi:hypothetical protein